MVLLNGKRKYIAVVAIFYSFIILLVKEKFPYICTKKKSHTISNRILHEDLNNFISKDIFRREDITLNNLNFIQTKLKNDKDGEIIENNDTENVDDNIFQRMYKFVQNFFYGNKKNNTNQSMKYRKYEHFNKINDIYEFMRNNGLPISTTSICLIDTGLDIKDEIINHFLNNDISTYNSDTFHSVNINYKSSDSFNFEINTEKIDDDDYPEYESTFLEDNDGDGSYEANLIIQGDPLKRVEKKYEKNMDLQRSGIHVETCKAFDNSKEKKNISDIIPIIKCLEYCKTKNVKIIHIDYNINEKNEELIQIIEDLKNSGIFVVLPSKGLVNKKSYEDNSVIYPSSFFENLENVFFIGSLNYLDVLSDDVNIVSNSQTQKNEYLKYRKNYVFLFDSINGSLKKGNEHDISYYEVRYDSAFFINILTTILNIYPNISINELRNMLNYSIMSKETEELKTYDIFEGYFEINKFIHALLNGGIDLSGSVRKYKDVTPKEFMNEESVSENQEDDGVEAEDDAREAEDDAIEAEEDAIEAEEDAIEAEEDSSADVYYDKDGADEDTTNEGGELGEHSEKLLEEENFEEMEKYEIEDDTPKDLDSVKENDIYVFENETPFNSSFMQINNDDKVRSKYVDNFEEGNYRPQYEMNRYPTFSEGSLRGRQNMHNAQMVNGDINYSGNVNNIEELYDNNFEGYRGNNLNPEYNKSYDNNKNINSEFGVLNNWRKNNEGSSYLSDSEEAHNPFEWMDMQAGDIYRDKKNRLKENNYDNDETEIRRRRRRRRGEENKQGRYMKNRNMRKTKKFGRDGKNRRYINRQDKRRINEESKYNNSIVKRQEMKSYNNSQKGSKIIPRKYSR
ncbi:conserved Plasmodium protein, unknown function [Plasmodium vinckei vinckei]|uniref:subtilisin n=1 Tax=Plasmodium vinckei vinckei TaxID=54757 RepID=A0A449BUU4_PLAVN|nr:conserved Plasmodium protein, unknown function [Plasmodium vinckei vinckei]KEG02808.1 hypothetical protein YYE_02642 [Plasmodium vinckei vinckei]VEV57198.1 conserved Plasmodium protein, unknown function [Plasmodium vinckei vinckei]